MKKKWSQKAYFVFTLILGVFLLQGCGGDGGGGHWDNPVDATDLIAPTVTLTAPANTETGVAVNRKITATFSIEMDGTTLASPASSFTLKESDSGSIVGGSVTYLAASKIATFTPTSDLADSTKYTATVTTLAQDLAGNGLAVNKIWTFTTGTSIDTTAPTVLTTSAADGDTGIFTNADSTVTFSEPMDPATLVTPATSFTVTETLSGTPVAGDVTYIGKTATFIPTNELKPVTEYTSLVSADATDLAGNPLISGLRANPWSWTTGAASNDSSPTITITNPANLDTDVAIDRSVNATFSEEMAPATITTANFMVQKSGSPLGAPLLGVLNYDPLMKIATFVPDASLEPDTDYTVTVTDGATDLAANALVVPAVADLPVANPWTFRTAAAVIPPPLAITLGTAESFGIASRAGLTSTGVTVVNGDVALYPLDSCTDATGNSGASQSCLVQTYSSPTGMTVNGSIYWSTDSESGATALAVTTDLTAAWVEGKAKIDTLGPVAGDQLSSTIPYLPGVYHNADLGLEANGVATLDAGGDANAIFIFKVDSSFVDSGTLLQPTEIVLVNGAQARNVWFVVGLDATIGYGSTWNGNILAGRTATVNSGSTVMGRILAGASGAGAFTITGAASPSVTTISVP